MAVASSDVTAITFTVPTRSLNALKSTGDSTLKKMTGRLVASCTIRTKKGELTHGGAKLPFGIGIWFYDAASSFRTFRITTR